MPQVIFKGVKPEDVAVLSQELLVELAEISQTPSDYFLFECPNVQYFYLGKETTSYPLIEVIQYDRGPEVEGMMAAAIQASVKQVGYAECEVYFTHLSKENYYEWGDDQ